MFSTLKIEPNFSPSIQLWIAGCKSESTLNFESVLTSIYISRADDGILSNSAMKNRQELIYSFSAQLLWKSLMYCCALLSYRELTAEIKPGCGVWALWCCARGWTMCAVQTSEGGARARSWPPDAQEALPQEYWWWLARSPCDRGSSLKPPAATD